MVEYALLAGLIAVVALTTLSSVGNGVKNQFSAISSKL
jgi:Flp pilus assembly pilin Flp